MGEQDRADQTRFTYSEVFTEETSQDLLFKRVAQPLLDDFIDAERSCFLFAYGNSNAGTTRLSVRSTWRSVCAESDHLAAVA